VSMRRDGTVELVKIENVAVRVKEIVDRELAALMPE